MRLAFVQMRPIFGEIEKNVEKAVYLISTIEADLVVLPELFSTGSQFLSKKEVFEFAEDWRTGYAVKRLAETARKNKSHIVAGFAEKAKARVYNSAMLVGPKGVEGVYRKVHLFWHEKDYFSPGNTMFDVHDIGHARVGMMICFDWIFPEAARALALKKADVIAHPSNLVLPYCPEAMRTRCLENRVYAVTANRVGCEERIKGDRLRFIGLSQIVAPDGSIIYRAGRTREEADVQIVDISKARDKRITPRNDIFKDRRKGFY
ncbi:MAG: acyltransferase [Deltaproteobacteria bacterium]|nr:acyltransferase [Deltaproteobacteria bacterium]